MKYLIGFLLFLLFILCSCQSCPQTATIAPIHRLQIPPEPVCECVYAVDAVECAVLRGEYIKLLQNNIKEFLEIYNNQKNKKTIDK